MSSSSHLTAGRFATSLGLAGLAWLLVVLLCPLIGVEIQDGQRTLSLLDLGQVWSGGLMQQIFVHDRLPRALAGAVVGGGLAAAGCVFQAILRNPLAEPYTLGISSGAALAAVVAIRVGATSTIFGESLIGLSALLGAAATIWVVWRLARVGSGHPAATLLLAGITIAMFCSSASLLLQYTADYAEVYRIVRWMMGGLDWIRYSTLAKSAIATAVGLAILLPQARSLNALAGGRQAAASVGIDITRTTRTSFAVASLLVGAGIAVAGPIGFVGLIVPHALRAIVGPDHRLLLPASIAVGGAGLVVCDTIARLVIAPAQLPVGVVTALIGGPFFLYLLLGEKSRSRLWGG